LFGGRSCGTVTFGGVAPNPMLTREKLISAAEQLFAERSIDGVSLRQINSAAGQRNSTALQYHFGGRSGLIRAVLDKHRDEIETRRHALLDEYEGTGGGDLRLLAAALVRPVAAELADPDGGRAYLRIMAQLVNRPGRPEPSRETTDPTDSIYRWRQLVAPLLPEVSRNRLHLRWVALRTTYVELARRAEEPPATDDRLFTSYLIDLVTSVLSTTASDETLDYLEASSRRRAEA
jgi:AcrR family transcriptional regulator